MLVVDDNAQNHRVELMQAYLETLNCIVHTAVDGVDALGKRCPRSGGTGPGSPGHHDAADMSRRFEACQPSEGRPQDTRDPGPDDHRASTNWETSNARVESGTGMIFSPNRSTNWNCSTRVKAASLLRVRHLNRANSTARWPISATWKIAPSIFATHFDDQGRRGVSCRIIPSRGGEFRALVIYPEQAFISCVSASSKTASIPADLDLATTAYLVGSDSVPIRGEFSYSPAPAGEIVCRKRAAGPAALTLMWDAKNFGSVMLETTRRPERDEPIYHLNMEAGPRPRHATYAEKGGMGHF